MRFAGNDLVGKRPLSAPFRARGGGRTTDSPPHASIRNENGPGAENGRQCNTAIYGGKRSLQPNSLGSLARLSAVRPRSALPLTRFRRPVPTERGQLLRFAEQGERRLRLRVDANQVP